MERLNKRGAKGSPWGTPWRTGKGELRKLLILMEVVRLSHLERHRCSL